MLQWEECRCLSETAPGWVAILVDDPDEMDEDAFVVMYCPPCAARELGYIQRTSYT